jgi:hypothetical protein
MSRSFANLFFFVLLLSACAVKKTTPPNVLSEEDMVSIMMDMNIVETAYNLKLTPNDSAYQSQFAAIFVSHNTTQAVYDSSLYYYATQTDRMDKIYDQMLERLYELETEVNPGEKP